MSIAQSTVANGPHQVSSSLTYSALVINAGPEEDVMLHTAFTETEAEIVRSAMAKDNGRITGMDIFQEIGYRAPTTQFHGLFSRSAWPLPGRGEQDVSNFVRDCYSVALNNMTLPSTDRVIQLPQLAPRPLGLPSLRLLRQLGIGTPSARNRRHQTRLMETIVRDNLGPWRIFKEGSSDVVDISWSPDGRTFALCCTYSHVVIVCSVV